MNTTSSNSVVLQPLLAPQKNYFVSLMIYERSQGEK